MKSLQLSVSIPSMGMGTILALAERVHHALQGAVQKRQALRPRRSGVGQRERVQESAVGRSAAVGDEAHPRGTPA